MNDNFGLKGVVTRQLFDKNGKAKLQFQENKLWKFFVKFLGLDLRINFITGIWTKNAIKCNTITTVGKQVCAKQLGGTTTTPVTAIAIGTGSPSATALGAEITTYGGTRGSAAVTNITTTTTGDTEQWIKTFTFSNTFAITEEGLFDNNTSAGNMLASQHFSTINVVSGDSLQITHQIKFS